MIFCFSLLDQGANKIKWYALGGGQGEEENTLDGTEDQQQAAFKEETKTGAERWAVVDIVGRGMCFSL
jgi:hypothetical protein